VKDKEKVVKEQYEAWVSTYDKDKVEIIRNDTGVGLGEFVNRILDNCHLKDGQNILDAGTGTGLIAMSIARRLSGNCRILGIDITDAMLEEARVNIEKEHFENAVSLRKASAEKIPADNDVYDVIVCVFTMRHTNIESALGEFMRTLKPEARVVIVDLYAPEKWRSLPARIILPIVKLFLMRKKEMRAEKESALLTPGEWKTLAAEIGGKDIHIERFPHTSEPKWRPGKMIMSWTKN
jgi:ubiquinone/menaquinone biosynthesis C-methylase UbiE